MNHILNRYLPFLMKSPLFCLFWTLFGQFLGTFPIRPVLMIPWLLNWIIFWIESAEFFLNWIIFWIESWVKQYWIEYWMNHFLAKFKHWIESDRVSNTLTQRRWLGHGGPWQRALPNDQRISVILFSTIELNSYIVPLRWVSEAHNVKTVMWLWPEMIGPILGTISQQWDKWDQNVSTIVDSSDVTLAIQSHGTSTSVADRATRRAPLLQ